MSQFLSDLANLSPHLPLRRFVWLDKNNLGQITAACPLTQFCLQNDLVTGYRLVAIDREFVDEIVLDAIEAKYDHNARIEAGDFYQLWDSSSGTPVRSTIHYVIRQVKERYAEQD